MAIFWKKPNDSITVNIDSQNIIFCCFKNKNILTAYQKFEINNFEIHKLNIFNFSTFQILFNNFIENNHLTNFKIFLSLADEQIQEIITKDDNYKTLEFKNLTLAHYILCQSNNEKIIYISGIPQSLLFQYKLLMINLSININEVTTETLVLYKLCKIIDKNLLKNVSAVSDIKKYFQDNLKKFNIENFISTDLKLNFDAEKFFLLKAFGLLLLGESSDEKL